MQRPRPYDVVTIGRWDGYSPPSATPAIVSITSSAPCTCSSCPAARGSWPSRRRGRGRASSRRLYLAVDHPFDVLVGVALGVAIPLLAFRYFTPNEVFPVTYHWQDRPPGHRRRRGEAMRRAVEEQLGVTVVDLQPVGLAGSGGSTPLRIRLAGDPRRTCSGSSTR